MSQTNLRPSPRDTAAIHLRKESINASSGTSNSARSGLQKPESERSSSHLNTINQNIATPTARSVSSRSRDSASSSLYSNSKLPPVNASILASREQPRPGPGHTSSRASPSTFAATDNTHSAPTPRRSVAAILVLKDKEPRVGGNTNAPPTPLDRASLYPTASPRTSIQANSPSQASHLHTPMEKETNETSLVIPPESNMNTVSISNRKYESGLVTMSARSIGSSTPAPALGSTKALKSCADTDPDLILSSPFCNLVSSTCDENQPIRLQTKFQNNIHSAMKETQTATCIQHQQTQLRESQLNTNEEKLIDENVTAIRNTEIRPFDQTSTYSDDDLVNVSFLHESTQSTQKGVEELKEHDKKDFSFIPVTIFAQQDRKHEQKEEKNCELVDYGFADLGDHNDSITNFPTESMEKYRKDILSSYKYFETNDDEVNVENSSNNVIPHPSPQMERESAPNKALDASQRESSTTLAVSNDLNSANDLARDSEQSQTLETSTLHLNFRSLGNDNGDPGAYKEACFPESPDDSYLDETGYSNLHIMPFLVESGIISTVQEENNTIHEATPSLVPNMASARLSSATFTSPQKQRPEHSLEMSSTLSHLQTPVTRRRETITTLLSSIQPAASMHRSPIEIHANFDLDCSFNDSLNSFIVPQSSLRSAESFNNTTKVDKGDNTTSTFPFQSEMGVNEDKPIGLVGIPETCCEKIQKEEPSVSRSLSHKKENDDDTISSETVSNKPSLANRNESSLMLTVERSFTLKDNSLHAGFTMVIDDVFSAHDENNNVIDHDDVFMLEDTDLSRIEHQSPSHSLMTPKDVVARDMLGDIGVDSIDCDPFTYSSDQETTDHTVSSPTTLLSTTVSKDNISDPSHSLHDFVSSRSTPNSGRYGNVKASPSANISFPSRLNSLNSTNTSANITSVETENGMKENDQNDQNDQNEIEVENNTSAIISLLNTSINTSLNTSLDDFTDLHRVFHKLEQLEAINTSKPLPSLNERESVSPDDFLSGTLGTPRSETVSSSHRYPSILEEQYQQQLAHERNLHRIRDHRANHSRYPNPDSDFEENQNTASDGIYMDATITKSFLEGSSPSQSLRRSSSSSLYAPATPRARGLVRTQETTSSRMSPTPRPLTPRANLLDTSRSSPSKSSASGISTRGICSSDWVKIPFTVLLTLLIGFYVLQKYAEYQVRHAARDRYRDVY